MQVQQLEQTNSDAIVATAAYPRARLVSCGSPSGGYRARSMAGGYIARSMAGNVCCSTPSTDGSRFARSIVSFQFYTWR